MKNEILTGTGTVLVVGPPRPGNSSAIMPEFGRWQDVQRVFGIRRGKLYQLLNAGLIRSVSLRRPGQTHSCRLIHLQSVRDYLQQLLAQQEAARKAPQ